MFAKEISIESCLLPESEKYNCFIQDHSSIGSECKLICEENMPRL